MLGTRILAALVFTPALLWAIWAGGLPLQVVCVALCLLLAYEYAGLVFASASLGLRSSLMGLTCLVALAQLGALPPATVAQLPRLCFFVAMAAVLWRPAPLAQAPQQVGLCLLGTVWCGSLLPQLAVLRGLPGTGLGLALLTLLATWASDTAAYAAGRVAGRTPLYAAISPSKTREGALGGLLGAAASGAGLGALLPQAFSPARGALLGAACAISGLVGDLCESMLKRSVGAKDSSRLIPGHGGVFDRFDGILFAAGTMSLLAPWLQEP